MTTCWQQDPWWITLPCWEEVSDHHFSLLANNQQSSFLGEILVLEKVLRNQLYNKLRQGNEIIIPNILQLSTHGNKFSLSLRHCMIGAKFSPALSLRHPRTTSLLNLHRDRVAKLWCVFEGRGLSTTTSKDYNDTNDSWKPLCWVEAGRPEQECVEQQLLFYSEFVEEWRTSYDKLHLIIDHASEHTEAKNML